MYILQITVSLLSPRGLEMINSMGGGGWSLPLCTQLAE